MGLLQCVLFGVWKIFIDVFRLKQVMLFLGFCNFGKNKTIEARLFFKYAYDSLLGKNLSQVFPRGLVPHLEWALGMRPGYLADL